jgi:hypothetical protein
MLKHEMDKDEKIIFIVVKILKKRARENDLVVFCSLTIPRGGS